MPYREATKGDGWRAGAYIILTIAVPVASAAMLIPVAWPIGFAVWLALFAGGSLYLLVRRHAKSTAYRCPACRHEFEISVLSDLASPQLPGKKYLQCPQCGKRNWATVLMKKS